MTSPIPTYANLIWVSARHVHVAVPTPSGEPYVISHHRTVEGLASVLGILTKSLVAQPHLPPEGPPSVRPTASHAMVRKVDPVIYTEEQRKTVRELLKKQGLI